MAKNELEIRIIAKDEVTKQMKKITQNTKKSTSTMQKSWVDLTAKLFLFQRAIQSVQRVLSGFVSSASQVEQLNVRLKVMLGSVEAGNELFSDMRDLASELPFEFNQVMESATTMAGVVKGGGEEVTAMMPMIADLAAASGLGIQETTGQMVRMYSAGAGAADLFRERGILAMLGFEAGVAMSAKETMKQVNEAWLDGGSKFRGATDELKDTWVGRVSIMKDAWFNFSAELGKMITENEGLMVVIDNLTMVMTFWTEEIKKSGEEVDSFTAEQEELERQIEMVNDLLEVGSSRWMAWTDAVTGGSKGVETHNRLLEKSIMLNAKLRTSKTLQAKQEVDLGKIVVTKGKEKTDWDKYKTISEEQWYKNSMGMANAGLNLAQEIAGENKAIAIGMATVKTAQGVARALSDYPFPVSAVIGGLVAAAGAVQIAKIASTPMAEGGIVPATPGGRLATIGEGGRDEAVIPLDQAGDRLTGLGGITVENIVINGNIEGDDIGSLAEEIGFEIERELRYARSI